MRRLAFLAGLGRAVFLTLPLTGAAFAQPAAPPAPGTQPGHGYTQGTDPNGIPYIHGVVDPGTMAYATVTIGTTSTPVLAAPLISPRTKLYLLNPSGRGGGTATDAWCVYGGPAAVGQGFILMGYGDRVSEDMGATIDQRAIACIAAAPVTITVGAVQQ